ncbi:phosphatase PAP2 family protein [Halostella sp. PRR32]|uniref:phosphatase PAP2 family protein n=1 Tax=Halostella sp. PRR32 TaxID=3098147 RepID=UPI002B1E2F78|nr:phosphatase PAP2 family protein [Halostella sp. PRR32]
MTAVETAWTVTHFGDYNALLALTVGYGVLVRRLDLRPVVMTYAAIAVTTWVKATVALPRPPGAAVGGFAFPSGHACVSLVALGSIALIEDDGIGRRAVLAGVFAGLIGFSRLVIGVHYVRDVLAGWALGAALLLVGVVLFDKVALARGPMNTFTSDYLGS